MFFIIGISQGEKKLKYDELIVCECCGKYGHVEIFTTYTYLMLFFIPVLKWNKKYIVRMNCCGSICQLDSETGRAIERGENLTLKPQQLNFQLRGNKVQRCPRCGFTTWEDFQFCPKCGKPME